LPTARIEHHAWQPISTSANRRHRVCWLAEASGPVPPQPVVSGRVGACDGSLPQCGGRDPKRPYPKGEIPRGRSQGGDPKGEIPRGRSQGRDLTGHSVHCKLYVVGSCCWVSRRSVTNLLRCGSAEWSGGGVWREVETVFVPWRDLRSSSMGEGAKEIDGADSQGTRVYE